MTILNKDAMKVTADLTDTFGASVPTTEAGLEKQAGQTGIFIFTKADYDLYLKNAAGAWVKYGSISGARETLTVPWGDNTAAFFKCADATATMHVHRKEGNILYDSTPENDGDDQNTLLTDSATLAQASSNYDFPAADGTAGQILETDGAGQLSWADAPAGGGGGGGWPGLADLSISTNAQGNHEMYLAEADNGKTLIIPILAEHTVLKLPPTPSTDFKISLTNFACFWYDFGFECF